MNDRGLWSRLRRLLGFRIAAVLLGVVGIAGVAPRFVVSFSPASHDPRQCSLRAADGTYQDRLSPSSDHWFGTDAQGCDEFARVIHGARSSMAIGISAALIMTVVGTALGVVAGYRGGAVDSVVRRAGDVTLGVPIVVGAILLLSVLAGEQRGPFEIALTLASLGWPGAARIARSATRSIVVLPYIESARALGAGNTRIVVRHVLPNALPTVIAYATPAVGALIAAEATLSYLGIGLQIPSVSWGLMIDAAQPLFDRSPHLLLFPAGFLVAVVAGFVLLGDALADAVDPHRSRET